MFTLANNRGCEAGWPLHFPIGVVRVGGKSAAHRLSP